MKSTFKLSVGSLLLVFALPTLAAPPVDPLDQKYGVLSQPAYIKHYEADKNGRIPLNPHLQVASHDFPAVLSSKMAPYNWAIDAEGRVTINTEAFHPLGRKYEKGFIRPEDKSKRKPGTRENYGHVTSTGGAPARISGEFLFDKGSKSWVINNKSGRYSKHNNDRTPEQFAEAVKLIRAVVDPGPGTTWGPALYLLEYTPAHVREKFANDPAVQYDDPKKKSRPHLVIAEESSERIDAEKATTK